ncbi:MAG TPA: TraR/DksA family transcriptional regulator [Acidobacteriaceae bacterium]|nr:TraR/DksA family transcriptional regulator [Acidobacteriaceae bacterium]
MALTSQKIREYKKRLLQQKRTLERSALAAVEQGRETVIDDAADAADQAVLSYEKEFLFTRGTHDHGQLALVKSALERMAEGTYGECVACGTEIGAKRLEAVPWTQYCISCQEKMERGELEFASRAA